MPKWPPLVHFRAPGALYCTWVSRWYLDLQLGRGIRSLTVRAPSALVHGPDRRREHSPPTKAARSSDTNPMTCFFYQQWEHCEHSPPKMEFTISAVTHQNNAGIPEPTARKSTLPEASHRISTSRIQPRWWVFVPHNLVVFACLPPTPSRTRPPCKVDSHTCCDEVGPGIRMRGTMALHCMEANWTTNRQCKLSFPPGRDLSTIEILEPKA